MVPYKGLHLFPDYGPFTGSVGVFGYVIRLDPNMAHTDIHTRGPQLQSGAVDKVQTGP